MKENTSITDEKVLQVYKIIGDNVKRIRKEKNVSQMQLVLAIGHKAVGTISMAELYNKHFNIEHLIKIADILEVNLSDLFYGIQQNIK